MLGEELSENKLSDLNLGVMNIAYDAVETPTQTPTLATSEAKTFNSQKTSSDGQTPEKEDLGGAVDHIQSEKEPESGQLVDQHEQITKL